MCELLGMSANVPTDICFSFTGLMQRGGGTGPHKDGWGITFYEGNGCRTFKDPLPSFNSPIARLVQDYPIKSCAVVSHIRQANRGEIPIRELWGRNWTFAHNGQLKGYLGLKTGHFRPVGQTDSEYAFCWLLNQLAQRYPRTPFGKATLLDQDVEIDFQQQTTPNDVVTVLATQPMTGNETWHQIMPGEFVLFCLGERVA
ncbi:MAG: class II glutamine amidotransferase [Symbiopectobacterium sp.]|uniref:class II glutamine amidotransferase n=1 Tax=Symbiopectobacterium sp. TaxID=2952789 RepID=UPI0039EA7485